MGKTVKFYLDFLSPYSYLASTQLPALVERTGATIAFKPIDILTLMQRVGNQPTTVLCKAKLAYAFQDLARWAEEYDVPLTPNPHLQEIDVTPLLLGAIAAIDAGAGREYIAAIFEAYWVNQAPFADETEILATLNNAGVPDTEQILAASKGLSPRLEANIAEAEQDGVFGVPSFRTETALYFGNDRLPFLERGLAA